MKIILSLLVPSLCIHHCNEDISDYLWVKRHLFCSPFWTCKSRNHGTSFDSQVKRAIQMVDGEAKQKANLVLTEEVETVGHSNIPPTNFLTKKLPENPRITTDKGSSPVIQDHS